MRLCTLLAFVLLPLGIIAQHYTTYFTGNSEDFITQASGGICLMGGATEDDNAMRWFLQRANGGDILVLRTSGSDGYNSYLFSELGIPVNSVETIVCHNELASHEPYILQKIQQAEAIWLAGGDQWRYIDYWRDSPIAHAIHQAIKERNLVMGGTSAGMAVQGQFYFSAQNGTITSEQALSNPFHPRLRVDSAAFFNYALLQNTITDTHFDNPDRRGRLVTFLARIYKDYGVWARAIACDEYTAVCIDEKGLARVFGGYPDYEDQAYFVQVNCGIPEPTPENCTPDNALTWDLGGVAIKAYRIKGEAEGKHTFDLSTWETGTGGSWLNWFVQEGVFAETLGDPLDCQSLSLGEEQAFSKLLVYPNPFVHELFIEGSPIKEGDRLQILNALGTPIYEAIVDRIPYRLDLSGWPASLYWVRLGQHLSRVYKIQ
jgi:cyanophycinase-like exopeptidase